MKYRWLAFAMPAAFMLAAWLLIQAMLPPAPSPHPVDKLRQGKVHVGDSLAGVEGVLGRWPSGIIQHPDGSFDYLYLRTAADSDFTNDEATVVFDSTGHVVAIRFDRSQAPAPSAQP